MAHEKVAATMFEQKGSDVITVALRAAEMSREYHSLTTKLLFK